MNPKTANVSRVLFFFSVLFLVGNLSAQETGFPAPASEAGETPTASERAVIEAEEQVAGEDADIVAMEENATIKPAPKKPEETIPVQRRGDSFFDKYIRDRLSIGTRVLWYSLTDTESGEEFNGSFIGSLNRTTEEQDAAPVYFYLEYAISPYFGVGISYDQFKVKTLDSGGGDGTFELDGPIIYAFGRFENGSAFTPFGEIGLAFYGTSFDARPEWTFSNGGTTVINRFEPDDSTGFVIGGGLDIEIIKHLSANIYLRYVSVDIDVDYFFSPFSTTTPLNTATFPGDHFAYGLGLKYTF
ncbi:MAG: hypothetical protein AAGJ81_13340 [Verrucomicrobiota bacterium]